jgi:hypothetical protein
MQSIAQEQIVANATTSAATRSKRKRKQTEEEKQRSRQIAFQRTRIGDLNKLFRSRYGGEFYEFPEDDAGRDDLLILLHHYAYSNPQRAPKVVQTHAPWLTGAELDDFMADAIGSPRMWEFQELGDYLNLKEADRSALKIRTIGTIDMTPAERKERRKHANRLYQKAKRQAGGATPREQCKSRLEPWKAVGMTRSTFYRWQKKQLEIGETNSSAVNLVDTADETVSLSKPMAKRKHYRSCERCPGEAVRIGLPVLSDQAGLGIHGGTGKDHAPATQSGVVPEARRAEYLAPRPRRAGRRNESLL